jgi:hypothetical protein
MERGSIIEVRVFVYFLGELFSLPVHIRHFCDLHRGKSFLLIKLVQHCIWIVSPIMRFRYIDIWLVGLMFIFPPVRRIVTSIQAPPVVEEETPFQNTQLLKEQK